MKSPKKGTLAWFKKELDRIFSIYIRMRDRGVCFTCGDIKHWKYQQNGHFVSRIHLSLRFDEINCHCQCAGCNIFKSGNMDEYSVRLVRKYGKNVLETLNKRKWETVKLDIAWYTDQIEGYNSKITLLSEKY